MTIAFTEEDVSRYMDVILAGIENPVLCDNISWVPGGSDAISDGTDVLIPVSCSISSARVSIRAIRSPYIAL
ncbi:MAG: hypothetical protein ACLRSW_01380 [Christensenellaceae bacterium]